MSEQPCTSAKDPPKSCPEGVSASVGAWLANNPVFTCQSESSEADDLKSTCSSHPFASPHPSDNEEHQEGDGKRGWKRKSGPRPAYPKSERQQLALLKQLDGVEASPKSPKLAQAPLTTTPQSKTKPLGKIHKRNVSGETALHIAARKGEYGKCSRLLRAGADVNAVDNAGWTSLHEACNYGFYTAVRILVKGGANVNALGLEANTPLHDAVSNGHTKLVQFLLAHGADTSIVNEHGNRAIDMCQDDHIKGILLSGDVPSVSPSPVESDDCDSDSDEDMDRTTDTHAHSPNLHSTYREREKEKEKLVATQNDDHYKPDEKISSILIPAPIPPAVVPPPPVHPSASALLLSPPQAKAALSPAAAAAAAQGSGLKELGVTPAGHTGHTTPAQAHTNLQHKWTNAQKSPTGVCGGVLRSLRRRDALKKRRQHDFGDTGPTKRNRLQQHTSHKKVGRPAGGCKQKPSPKATSKDVYEFHSSDSDEHNPSAAATNALPQVKLQRLQITDDMTKPLQVIVDEKALSIKKRLLLRATLDTDTTNPGSRSAPASVLTQPAAENCEEGSGRRATSEDGMQRTVPPLKLILARSMGGVEKVAGVRKPSYFVAARRAKLSHKARPGKQAASRLTRSQVKTKGVPLISPKRHDEQVKGEAAALVDTLHPHKRKQIKCQISQQMVIEPSMKEWDRAHTASSHMLDNKNSIQAYNAMRQQIEGRWSAAGRVGSRQDHQLPQNFDRFKLSTKDYLLQRDMPAFEVSVSAGVPEAMRPVFAKQEEARHALTLQHRVERERLMCNCEKEIVRSGRCTMAGGLSVVRIFTDQEIYNPMQLDKPADNVCKPASSEEQVLARFSKLKAQLIYRHKLEADSLAAAQQLAWQGEMRRAGLILPHESVQHNHKHTPTIHVLQHFQLIPTTQ